MVYGKEVLKEKAEILDVRLILRFYSIKYLIATIYAYHLCIGLIVTLVQIQHNCHFIDNKKMLP